MGHYSVESNRRNGRQSDWAGIITKVITGKVSERADTASALAVSMCILRRTTY
jgi:hypothetical protein